MPTGQWTNAIEHWRSYRSLLIDITHAIAPDLNLRWYQRQIFHAIERADRVCIVASRQIGKSETILRFALAFALAMPDQLTLIASRGQRQAREILRRIRSVIKRAPCQISLHTDNATEIELYNHSRIISLPNFPETIRGYPANLVLIDEADFIPSWDEFAAALFPSVASVGGQIVCSGTFWGKRQLYRLSQDPRWHGLILPHTVHPDLRVDQLRHELPPAWFAQEFECVPMDETSTLFSFDMLAACTETIVPSTRPAPGALYVAGWDPAKLQDASMLYVLERRAESDRWRVCYSADYSGMAYSAQAAEIANLHRRLRFARVHVDCTGIGQGALELLQKEIGSVAEGITFTPINKIKLFNNLRIALQDRQLIIPADDAALQRELHDLHPRTLDLPSGSADHACALALAWNAYTSIGVMLDLPVGIDAPEYIDAEFAVVVTDRDNCAIVALQVGDGRMHVCGVQTVPAARGAVTERMLQTPAPGDGIYADDQAIAWLRAYDLPLARLKRATVNIGDVLDAIRRGQITIGQSVDLADELTLQAIGYGHTIAQKYQDVAYDI